MIVFRFSPFLVLFSFLFSCASTIEVERMVQNSTGTGRQNDPSLIPRAVPIEVAPPDPIIIERPIFIPQGGAVAALPQPAQGRSAVQAAIHSGIVQPQDYSNAAMIYSYDKDFVYELYARPFRMSNIVLEAGEQVIDIPFISDSERWMVGAGVSYENGVAVQHIYVKPTVANLTASLIINTDRRVYHLILRSFNDVQVIIFRYVALAEKRGCLRYVGHRESFHAQINKINHYQKLIRYNPTFFCFNDTEYASDAHRERAKAWIKDRFPEKSSYEK